MKSFASPSWHCVAVNRKPDSVRLAWDGEVPFIRKHLEPNAPIRRPSSAAGERRKRPNAAAREVDLGNGLGHCRALHMAFSDSPKRGRMGKGLEYGCVLDLCQSASGRCGCRCAMEGWQDRRIIAKMGLYGGRSGSGLSNHCHRRYPGASMNKRRAADVLTL